MKHLPTAPGMICAFGGVDVGVKTARDNESFPFEFSIVIPEHLPEVDGGEGASCARGELCEARMTNTEFALQQSSQCLVHNPRLRS